MNNFRYFFFGHEKKFTHIIIFLLLIFVDKTTCIYPLNYTHPYEYHKIYTPEFLIHALLLIESKAILHAAFYVL